MFISCTSRTQAEICQPLYRQRYVSLSTGRDMSASTGRDVGIILEKVFRKLPTVQIYKLALLPPSPVEETEKERKVRR